MFRSKSPVIVNDRVYVTDEDGDLRVADATLTPSCLEAGVWPTADEWGLSDHGVVSSRFVRWLCLEMSRCLWVLA